MTGTTVAPKISMMPSYSANTLAFKMDLNDKVSVGYADYLSAGIFVDYRDTGAIDAFVDLSIRSRLLAAKYQIDDNMSIFGGLKYSKTSDARANVLKNVKGNLSIPSATDSALALGFDY